LLHLTANAAAVQLQSLVGPLAVVEARKGKVPSMREGRSNDRQLDRVPSNNILGLARMEDDVRFETGRVTCSSNELRRAGGQARTYHHALLLVLRVLVKAGLGWHVEGAFQRVF